MDKCDKNYTRSFETDNDLKHLELIIVYNLMTLSHEAI